MNTKNVWSLVLFCLSSALGSNAWAGVNSWTATALYGGSSYSVAIDPTDPKTLYEASPGGGVFKSSDGGATWASANVGITDLGCQSIAIDPTHPQVLYTSGQISVFKSTDGANTWTAVGAVFDGRQYVVSPTTPSTIFALSAPYGAAYVVKSVDSGQHWTSSSTGIDSYGLRGLTIDPRSPQTLYVAGDTGVYRSVNGGLSWTLSTTGLTAFPYVNSVAVDPLDSQILYAASDTAQGVFKSTDAGQTWAPSGVGVPSEDDPTLVAVDPAAPSHVYLVAGGAYSPNSVYVSSDAGAHWTNANSGLPKHFGITLRSISIAPSSPSTLYLGTDLGVYASADRGQSWIRRVTGLTNLYVNAVAVDPVTPTTIYAGTANSGVFKSVDNGRSWGPIDNGLPGLWYGKFVDGVSAIAINPHNPSVLYIGAGANAAGQSSSVFKSIDAGATWQVSVNGALSDRPYTITSLALDPNHPKTLFAGDGRGFGIAESTDGAATWAWVNSGLPVDTPINKVLVAGDAVAIASTSPLAVYVAPYTSSGGAPPKWAAVDAANALDFIASYFGVNVSLVELAAILKDLGGPSFPALSSPGDARFNPSNCDPYTGLTLDPIARKSFYMTGQCGVVLVAKLGATVGKMNSGLPFGLAVNALATTPSGKILFAATAGGGVYKYTISP